MSSIHPGPTVPCSYTVYTSGLVVFLDTKVPDSTIEQQFSGTYSLPLILAGHTPAWSAAGADLL